MTTEPAAWIQIMQAVGFGAVGAAVIGGIVALVGHFITRSNSKLQAKIAQDSSALAAQISDSNAKLGAEVSRQGSELSNRISRENARLAATLSANIKLAEMRQAWINNLRSDMAEFQAMAVTPDMDFQRETKFYQLMARIELSLNPQDEDYGALETALNQYIKGGGEAERRANDAPYVAVCQRILKREWDVLKDEIEAITKEGAAGSVAPRA